MELLQFEKEYRIHVYETGPDGKLNLYSLFNYMQDIASDHAIKLGFGRDDLMRDNRFWVLSRKIDSFGLSLGIALTRASPWVASFGAPML